MTVTVLEFFLVMVPSVLVGMAVAFLIQKIKKSKTMTAGDLHIFPNEDGCVACYVAWETDPENLLKEEYALLKVIQTKNSQE